MLDHARAEIAQLNAALSIEDGVAAASICCTAAASTTRREGCWMGWERKRGKLHELNLLLRGDGDTTFLPPERAAAERHRAM